MKIGILQTGHAPDEVQGNLGDYDAMFKKLLDGRGFTFTTYDVVDNRFPDGPEDADGWLITGSRHGAYEDHGWIPPLEALIRTIRDSGRPLIGVCFGHQIIAQALGGKVEKHPAGWSVGHQVYDIDGEEHALHAWHQDQVTKAPEGARVFASSAVCENAGMVVGDNVMTIQPHPEFGAEMIEGLITLRGRGTVPDELLKAAFGKLGRPVSDTRFADRMVAFFRERAA